MSFESLGLSPSIVHATKILGYQQPFPIQTAVIPAILKKADIIGIAPTGTGKTASFVFPILSMLESLPNEKKTTLKVLVLVPTRELAFQIATQFNACSPYLKKEINAFAIVGGIPIPTQRQLLKNASIVIATPGRLLELLHSGMISLEMLQHVIIDEADKLFKLGFEEELNAIIKALPQPLQFILFSATLNDSIEAIKDRLKIEPQVFEIQPPTTDTATIKQLAYHVKPERKGPFLRYLIQSKQLEQVLVFVGAQRTADNLVDKLKKNKIAAVAIHGNKSQKMRTEILAAFKSGNIKVLVTTDLLVRGIHIDALPAVINYELPRSPLDYIHRIGRTGRANQIGTAITILTDADLHAFKIIQQKSNLVIPIESTDTINLQGY